MRAFLIGINTVLLIGSVATFLIRNIHFGKDSDVAKKGGRLYRRNTHEIRAFVVSEIGQQGKQAFINCRLEDNTIVKVKFPEKHMVKISRWLKSRNWIYLRTLDRKDRVWYRISPSITQSSKANICREEAAVADTVDFEMAQNLNQSIYQIWKWSYLLLFAELFTFQIPVLSSVIGGITIVINLGNCPFVDWTDDEGTYIIKKYKLSKDSMDEETGEIPQNFTSWPKQKQELFVIEESLKRKLATEKTKTEDALIEKESNWEIKISIPDEKENRHIYLTPDHCGKKERNKEADPSCSCCMRNMSQTTIEIIDVEPASYEYTNSHEKTSWPDDTAEPKDIEHSIPLLNKSGRKKSRQGNFNQKKRVTSDKST